MSGLRAIEGYVVAPALADEVVSPPYDALTPEERTHHVATHPRSFLSVLPEAEYTTGPELDTAETRLHELIAQGVFQPWPRPFAAVYRLRESDHVQTGLIAGVPSEWSEEGRILAHEATRPDRVEQLVLFLDRVGVASSPVSLAFEGCPDLVAEMERVAAGQPYIAIDDGVVQQQLWISEDPAELLAAGAGLDRLYITDGHHRTAAAVAHRGSQAGRSDAPLLGVLFPTEELRLVDYHRVLTEPEVGLEELAETLGAAGWEVGWLDQVRKPNQAGEVMAVGARGAWCARIPPRDEERDDPVSRLDVSRFHEEVLGAVLGVYDVRGHPGLRFVPGDQGLGPLIEAAAVDDAIGFALHPPSMAELMAVADAGEVMPPKSTYFTPKVRSGLLLRFLR